MSVSPVFVSANQSISSSQESRDIRVDREIAELIEDTQGESSRELFRRCSELAF
jgi:hypothetical protein